ncbi:hypothetical protein EDD36DRAFT_190565 [Exophiala viscosa]|uniref:Uncharacterized protein n=1 Tax=Exophiala viscosa TaxID=2486360 RepID=A0AAN6E1G9_9EURO|nr:hypothetical protein EDD36DRAFT_190565 [Exophiala viscosa]
MSQPKKQKLHHPSDDSRSVIAVNGGNVFLSSQAFASTLSRTTDGETWQRSSWPTLSLSHGNIFIGDFDPLSVLAHLEHPTVCAETQIPTSDSVRQPGSPPGSQRPDGVPDEPIDVPEVHHETSQEQNDVLAEQNSRHISDQPDGVPDEPDEGLEEHHEISQERGGVLVEQNGRQLSGQPDDVHNEPNEVLEEQNETSPEQDDVQVEQTGGQKSDQSEDTGMKC